MNADRIASTPCPLDGSVRQVKRDGVTTWLHCPWCKGDEVIEDVRQMLNREWDA